MKNCLFCKKPFEPKKPKAIYCSTKCRTYAGRGCNPDQARPTGRPKKRLLTSDEITASAQSIIDKNKALDKFIFTNDLDNIHPTPHKPDPFPVLQVKIKPAMPKGLSLSDQIKWKIDNLQ